MVPVFVITAMAIIVVIKSQHKALWANSDALYLPANIASVDTDRSGYTLVVILLD